MRYAPPVTKHRSKNGRRARAAWLSSVVPAPTHTAHRVGPDTIGIFRADQIFGRTLLRSCVHRALPAPGIVVHRNGSIRVPNHAHKPLHIAPKPCFNVFRTVKTHPTPCAGSGFRFAATHFEARQRKGDRHAREVLRLDDNGGHCRGRCRHFGVHRSDVGSGSTEFHRRASPGCGAENALGVSPICRAFGPTRTTRPCSAPPNMPTKNSSPRRSAPNLTKRVRQCSSTPTNRGRRGLRAMSPALTIHSSCPSSAPARAPR
jgi:hypothetical protein